MRVRVQVSQHEHRYVEVPDDGLTALAPCVKCPNGKTLLKPDYEIIPGLRDPLAGPTIEPAEAHQPKQVERHVNAFAWLRKQLIPVPRKCSGDGVVICGGGRYWPMVVFSVKMLRESSAIPVQVWHRPTERIDPTDLRGVPNVTYHDAAAYPHRILKTWEVKYLALVNCGLSRALLLDADAYLLADPAPLLDLVSAPPELHPDGVVKHHSYMAFWQDLHSQDGRVNWPAFGLEPEAAQRCAPVQGGHVVFNLASAAWTAVVWCHFLNQHSDYFYSHAFGDQDCLRAAIAAHGLDHTNLGVAGWRHPAYVCKLNGKTMIEHRARGKVLIEKTRHLEGDARYFRHVADWLRG